MSEHVTITDPAIHEPKDVTTASSGQVYVADGGGSGSWTSIGDDAIIIESQADLEANATEVVIGGVTTLRLNEGEYVINTGFSLSKSLSFPGTGKRVTIKARNRVTVAYTGANALWHDTDAEGEIEVQGLTEFTAASGSFFNVVAVTGSWSWQAIGGTRLTNCNTLGTVSGGASTNGAWNIFFGTISDFDQGLTATNMSFFEVNTVFVFGNNAVGSVNFTFNGSSWSGVINFIVVTFVNGANETMFDLNTSIQSTVDSITFNACQVEGGINGNVFAASSLDQKDTKVIANSNTIMDDTVPGGMLYMVNNATVTTIAAIDTPVLVAGTWTVEFESQFTGTTAGRLTYNDVRTINTPVDVSITVNPAAGTNKNIRAYIAKNGSVVTGSGKSVLTDTGDPATLSLIWQLDLATSDFIEVFIENKTDTTDITVTDIVLRIP